MKKVASTSSNDTKKTTKQPAQKKTKPCKRRSSGVVGVFIAIGAGIGVAIGVALGGSIAVFLAIGAGIGLVFGSARKAKEERQQQQQEGTQ